MITTSAVVMVIVINIQMVPTHAHDVLPYYLIPPDILQKLQYLYKRSNYYIGYPKSPEKLTSRSTIVTVEYVDEQYHSKKPSESTTEKQGTGKKASKETSKKSSKETSKKASKETSEKSSKEKEKNKHNKRNKLEYIYGNESYDDNESESKEPDPFNPNKKKKKLSEYKRSSSVETETEPQLNDIGKKSGSEQPNRFKINKNKKKQNHAIETKSVEKDSEFEVTNIKNNSENEEPDSFNYKNLTKSRKEEENSSVDKETEPNSNDVVIESQIPKINGEFNSKSAEKSTREKYKEMDTSRSDQESNEIAKTKNYEGDKVILNIDKDSDTLNAEKQNTEMDTSTTKKKTVPHTKKKITTENVSLKPKPIGRSRLHETFNADKTTTIKSHKTDNMTVNLELEPDPVDPDDEKLIAENNTMKADKQKESLQPYQKIKFIIDETAMTKILGTDNERQTIEPEPDPIDPDQYTDKSNAENSTKSTKKETKLSQIALKYTSPESNTLDAVESFSLALDTDKQEFIEFIDIYDEINITTTHPVTNILKTITKKFTTSKSRNHSVTSHQPISNDGQNNNNLTKKHTQKKILTIIDRKPKIKKNSIYKDLKNIKSYDSAPSNNKYIKKLNKESTKTENRRQRTCSFHGCIKDISSEFDDVSTSSDVKNTEIDKNNKNQTAMNDNKDNPETSYTSSTELLRLRNYINNQLNENYRNLIEFKSILQKQKQPALDKSDSNKEIMTNLSEKGTLSLLETAEKKGNEVPITTIINPQPQPTQNKKTGIFVETELKYGNGGRIYRRMDENNAESERTCTTKVDGEISSSTDQSNVQSINDDSLGEFSFEEDKEIDKLKDTSSTEVLLKQNYINHKLNENFRMLNELRSILATETGLEENTTLIIPGTETETEPVLSTPDERMTPIFSETVRNHSPVEPFGRTEEPIADTFETMPKNISAKVMYLLLNDTYEIDFSNETQISLQLVQNELNNGKKETSMDAILKETSTDETSKVQLGQDLSEYQRNETSTVAILNQTSTDETLKVQRVQDEFKYQTKETSTDATLNETSKDAFYLDIKPNVKNVTHNTTIMVEYYYLYDDEDENVGGTKKTTANFTDIKINSTDVKTSPGVYPVFTGSTDVKTDLTKSSQRTKELISNTTMTSKMMTIASKKSTNTTSTSETTTTNTPAKYSITYNITDGEPDPLDPDQEMDTTTKHQNQKLIIKIIHINPDAEPYPLDPDDNFNQTMNSP